MILIDTNIYVAFMNKRDQDHKQAKELVNKMLSGEFGIRFTISEVFSEAATLIYRRTKSKEIVKRAWDVMYSSDHAWGQMVIIGKDDIVKAWEIFQKFASPKESLSFVDCLLIAIAQSLGVPTIMSFDDEFDGILDRIY